MFIEHYYILEFSGFHLFLNPKSRSVTVEDIYAGRVPSDELKGGAPGSLLHQLRCGLILGGADIFPWPGGCVSAMHSEEDIEITAAALKSCLQMMQDN